MKAKSSVIRMRIVMGLFKTKKMCIPKDLHGPAVIGAVMLRVATLPLILRRMFRISAQDTKLSAICQ